MPELANTIGCAKETVCLLAYRVALEADLAAIWPDWENDAFVDALPNRCSIRMPQYHTTAPAHSGHAVCINCLRHAAGLRNLQQLSHLQIGYMASYVTGSVRLKQPVLSASGVIAQAVAEVRSIGRLDSAGTRVSVPKGRQGVTQRLFNRSDPTGSYSQIGRAMKCRMSHDGIDRVR